MMLVRCRFFLLVFVLFQVGVAEDVVGEAFEPPLYAFQNGVDFGSFEDEATTLKALGYDGIGSVGVKDLQQRIVAYDKVGLKVFSVYIDVQDEAVASAVKQLANRQATIELTVRRDLNAKAIETIRTLADLAAESDVRIALYPHAGFSIETIGTALEVIQKVDRPNVGVMFNLCHFLKSENPRDLAATIQRAGSKIVAVSTCGADEDGTSWSTLIQPLDRGSFRQSRLFEELEKIRFAGAVGIQCYAVPGDKRNNLERSEKAWRKILSEIN